MNRGEKTLSPEVYILFFSRPSYLNYILKTGFKSYMSAKMTFVTTKYLIMFEYQKVTFLVSFLIPADKNRILSFHLTDR